MKEFYVYEWLREDGTPYYVGKGKGNRAFDSNRRFSPEDETRIRIVRDGMTEIDAFNLEIERIILWGRKDLGTGILYNQSDGGRGGNSIAGKSESEIKKIYAKSHETKMRNGSYADSEETRKKRSLSSRKRALEKPWTMPNNKGRVFSGSGYKNMCEAAKLRRGERKYNDGVVEIFLKPGEHVPENFVLGRLPSVVEKSRQREETPEANEKRRQTITGSRSFTDGTNNVWVKHGETPPQGWRRGMTKGQNEKNQVD